VQQLPSTGFLKALARKTMFRPSTPDTVVHGPADLVVPERVVRETARLLPAGQFTQIRESGYVLLAEQPRHFNQLLEGLLAREPRTSPPSETRARE
jgi:pimeloyl-ACP methyl ester carboxylesterase